MNYYNKQKSMMERYVEAMQKTGDYMLAWQFQKNMIKEQLLREAELDRIADRVISRLSITVDASQIVQEIEDIHNAIERLGK